MNHDTNVQDNRLSESTTNRNADSPIASAREVVKDIAIGSFAGIVSEVFEYPFDLAKVRLQAQLLSSSSNTPLRFNGPLDCLKQTWRDEGIRGLYRGLPVPIVGSMVETAALFLSYTCFQNAIRKISSNHSSIQSARLSIPELGAAAAGAGFVTSFILTPIELVKCKMQVQLMNIAPATPGRLAHARSLPSTHPYFPVSTSRSRPTASYHAPIKSFISNARLAMHDLTNRSSPALSHKPPGILSVIRSITHTHGISGFWLGHTGTMLRETGASAAWFVVKEWVGNILRDRRLQTQPNFVIFSDDPGGEKMAVSVGGRGDLDTNLLPWESAVAGAVAGAVGALVLYPADTVKSAIQTEEELRYTRQSSGRTPASTFWNTFGKMYRSYGLKGLYAGCGMTVARAVPSSGIIFVVYDGLSAWIG